MIRSWEAESPGLVERLTALAPLRRAAGMTEGPRMMAGTAMTEGTGMTDLNGTRVLVTGATSGLGAAMASALTAAGARVIVTGRGLARAQTAARELGEAAIACQLDVRDELSVKNGVERAWDAWGGLDMLVNNAGIGMRTVNPRFLSEPQPFWEVPPAGFRDVLETKITGCFLVARAVVPLMRRAGRQHLDEPSDDGPAGLRPLRSGGRRR
jgi:NAD(P)-dependent dehydrogenase (short-subunit alcohol dehydrogenase family)